MLGGPPDANCQMAATTTTKKKNNKHSDTHTVASILSCSQADKAGWLRRFCGKGMFREIWKKRFVVLKDHQLMLNEKEGGVGADEVLDLSHFGSCDDVRNHKKKKKSRSKKNLSKFTLQRCRSAHNTVASVLFLALSPEDKESWISVLNVAINRAKNKILDQSCVLCRLVLFFVLQVTANEAQLCHLTRDRARICHGRRPPSRGHLLAVASSSDGTVTLDLMDEEDHPEESPPTPAHHGSRPHDALFVGSVQAPGKSQSLPRQAAGQGTGGDRTSGSGQQSETAQKNRYASADDICSHSDENRAVPPRSDVSASVSRLRRLISLKAAETERLLAAARDPPEDQDAKGARPVEEMRAQVCGLLTETLQVLEQARQVLREVQELGELHSQLDQSQDTDPDRNRHDSPT
ncbi:pleckstrin homology domain-containing family O member 1-like isoform X2 [Festucalex cinctus]